MLIYNKEKCGLRHSLGLMLKWYNQKLLVNQKWRLWTTISPWLDVDVGIQVSSEDIFGQVGEEEGVTGTPTQVEMWEFTC